MPRKLRNTTYKLTEQQIAWLTEQSEKTGLNKVEIVRRALDAYAQAEEATGTATDVQLPATAGNQNYRPTPRNA